MNVWFGGSEAADAICDVIFGDKVPCGKLTTSLPKATGQEPLYYNHQIQDVLYPMTILDLPNMPATSWMYAMAPSILLVMA